MSSWDKLIKILWERISTKGIDQIVMLLNGWMKWSKIMKLMYNKILWWKKIKSIFTKVTVIPIKSELEQWVNVAAAIP